MPEDAKRKPISRRTFVLAASSLAAAGAAAWLTRDQISSVFTKAASYNQLVIPPVIDGTTFDLTLAESSRQFFVGAKTPTFGYNGETFWGPTLRWKKGDTVSLKVTNKLSETTTAHWHGIHLPAEADGGPHQPIQAGETWSPPSFQVKNEAATYWYHPHMHETTQRQLTMGGGGFIIIEDDSEASKSLPREYGVDDIPLVLTSRRFDTSNAFDVSKDTAYGDYLLTNGVLNAETSVPAQLVRFRILNAETERFFNIGLENDKKFYVVATDGGLLNKPVEVSRLRVVPGERYEIVVDLSDATVGSTLDLKAYNEGMPFGAGGSETATTGNFGSLLNNTTFTLLHLKVAAASASGIKALPATLAAFDWLTKADAIKSRKVAITDNGPGTPFTFDGNSYDMMTINQTVELGTTEAWTITNDYVFGHAFHIHDVQFSIISRSTGEVSDQERGWKDTFGILPNETVTFVAKFDDYANSEHPYMYHCHMSNHEDGGLMGQFLVVDPASA